MKIEARLDHPEVAQGAPSVVHMLLTLTAPDLPSEHPRLPLNIAAVIDRSGSMAGEKLDYAKQSVRILLDQLAPCDRFSLVAFDDEVLPLVEGGNSANATAIGSIVDRIESGGSTNLSGGWLKGIELVSQALKAEQVNAVLLLTDGQANQGIVDPEKLVPMGESVSRDKGIRTSCMGLGRDFNEDLLKAVATAAGGRFHYIESPDHAPEVFREELGGLLAVVAQNVELTLEFADGVTQVAQLSGHAWKATGATCKIILGDFHAGQVKHVLLVAQLPAMPDVTDVLLASLRMGYAEVKERSVQIKQQRQKLIVQVVDSAAAAKPADPEVLLHIGIQKAAQARQAAVVQLDQGDLACALQVLEAERDRLRSMAAGTSAPDRLAEEAAALDERIRELREQRDMWEARKFMVSEGTQMSQSNYGGTQSARMRRSRPRPPSSTSPHSA